jgi:hypothetical protein
VTARESFTAGDSQSTGEEEGQRGLIDLVDIVRDVGKPR